MKNSFIFFDSHAFHGNHVLLDRSSFEILNLCSPKKSYILRFRFRAFYFKIYQIPENKQSQKERGKVCGNCENIEYKISTLGVKVQARTVQVVL